MKFVAMRSNLREVLGSIERAAGDIPNLPILRNALIEAKDGRITLTATNLEIGVVAVLAGKVLEGGSVVVPLGLLSGLLSNLQTDRLNIESKEHHIAVTTDNYNATLQGASAKDFPQIPPVENKKEFIGIKGILLKEAIQQVMVAAQVSDMRPELNSILFDFSIEALKLTATDGFRIAEKTLAKNALEIGGEIEPFKILVPLRTAQEVSRNFANEDIIRFYHDENQIIFKTDHLEITSRLVNGQFPEYSQLIPKDFLTEMTIDRNELINAIKVVSILGQKNNEVTLTLKQDKKTVIIHSADQSMGNNEYILPVKTKGDELDVILNWRYIADALKALSGDEVFLGFQEDVNPAIIRSTKDSTYFYILKPLMKG